MSKVIEVLKDSQGNAVNITERMLKIAGKFYGVNVADETQIPGLLGTLAAMANGTDKAVERHLLESVETREDFKEFREAVYRSSPELVDDSAQHPELHISEKIVDWDTWKSCLEESTESQETGSAESQGESSDTSGAESQTESQASEAQSTGEASSSETTE